MSYGTDADALNCLSKASSDLRGSGTPISVKEGKEIIKLNHAMNNLPQPEKKATTERLNPGFPRWIEPAGPKVAETLAKLPIPSFTRRVRHEPAT